MTSDLPDVPADADSADVISMRDVRLAGLIEEILAEVKSGAHVVTVKPGFVDTKMTSGLKLPGPLTAQPAQVATAIRKAVRKKSNVVYVLWMWRWIMLIIRSVPESIFKKLKL